MIKSFWEAKAAFEMIETVSNVFHRYTLLNKLKAGRELYTVEMKLEVGSKTTNSLRKLDDFELMSDFHLARINIAKRIDLSPADSKAIRSAP